MFVTNYYLSKPKQFNTWTLKSSLAFGYDIKFLLTTASRSRGEQPHGGDIGATKAHTFAAHNGVFQCLSQHGDVATLYGGCQQASR